MLPAERHRLAKQRKQAHFIQPPWHIWVLADTETGPGCGGAGVGAALQGSVLLGRETGPPVGRLWGVYLAS